MSKKIIVFDMDKTIGDFDLISLLYNTLKKYTSVYIILDVFFECFRPCIFDIFAMLQEHKNAGLVEKIVLYTNNTGGVVWVKHIIDYIHYKLNAVLFDHLITALYVNNGEIPDFRRTSIEKTYTDLQNILNLDTSTLVIFIDDVYHEKMLHSNVKYIQITPYHCYIHNETITKRIKNINPNWNLRLPTNKFNFECTYNNNISKQLLESLVYYITTL